MRIPVQIWTEVKKGSVLEIINTNIVFFPKVLLMFDETSVGETGVLRNHGSGLYLVYRQVVA